MLKQRNQRLFLLVPYVLLCDKNLPACSSAITVLTAPLVLNLIYVPWAFFFHWNSQALPFLVPKLTKHQVVHTQFEDFILIFLMSMFQSDAFLLHLTNSFRVHSSLTEVPGSSHSRTPAPSKVGSCLLATASATLGCSLQ